MVKVMRKNYYNRQATNTMSKEQLKELFTNAVNDALTLNQRVQLCHMNAYVYYSPEYQEHVLVSYRTPVAMTLCGNVIEFGVYSSTTSKQVTRFCDEYTSCGNVLRTKMWNSFDISYDKENPLYVREMLTSDLA